ncbi:MAG: serine/threonine-protein kinase [Sumerlaeia bacterium]
MISIRAPGPRNDTQSDGVPISGENTTLPQLPPGAVFPLALYRGFPDRFQVYEKIGEGGYGQVWRARARSANEWVAIKFLRPELLLFNSRKPNQDFDHVVRRFQREAELTARLTDESLGVAKVLETGGNARMGIFYMMMDYIAGVPLDKLILREKGLRPGLVSRYVLQVARTLKYAHDFTWDDPQTGNQARGIVHRDIKPGNIIIRQHDNAAILCDFGIAGIVEGAERLTLPHMQVCSYKYTAPEVLESNDISPATDMWGLAVTAYVALTGGRFPYPGATLLETLRNTQAGKLIPLDDSHGLVSDELKEFLHRALDPDPARRLRTAEDFVRHLEPLVYSETDNSVFLSQNIS